MSFLNYNFLHWFLDKKDYDSVRNLDEKISINNTFRPIKLQSTMLEWKDED